MKKVIAIALVAAMAAPVALSAQDKFTVSGKADFVSDYVWRGLDQKSGFSVQPTLAMSYKGFTLSAWGSQSLTNFQDNATPQEFDVALAYNVGGFTATLTDYWWNGKSAAYGYYEDGHHLEVAAAYRISDKVPLTLSWATMVAFNDPKPTNADDNAYSTYINAAYDINCPADITLTPSVGFTPWKGAYYAEGAAITDISLKASKTLEVTDKFSIPMFVQAVVAPHHTTAGSDHVFFVAGFSLGF